jgi:hypothetical protein
VGNVERARNIACDGSVNSDADAAIFPGGDFRWWDWFRAILVGSVVSQISPVIFFRHSLRLSVCLDTYFIGKPPLAQTVEIREKRLRWQI